MPINALVHRTALLAGMLLGLTDALASHAPARQAELLPPDSSWMDASVLACARAHLHDLQGTSLSSRARVAQACTSLHLETQVFIVHPPSRALRQKGVRHAGAVTGGKPSMVLVAEGTGEHITADAVRHRMGQLASASLRGFLTGWPEAEGAACNKVVVRYQVNDQCQPSVHVTVTDAANDNVELAISRRMHRSLWAACAGLDCTSLARTLDGTVSLIPVRSGPVVSMVTAR